MATPSSTPSKAKKPVEKAAEKIDAPVVNEKERKLSNFMTRAFWTFVMIGGFFATLAAGHFWCILLILLCQITTFRECIAVAATGREYLRLTKTLNWWFLFSTIYYLDGQTFYQFIHIYVLKYGFLQLVAANHKFISYMLFIIGFVVFVSTLKKGHLRFQFAQLCITHMVLLLVVFQAHLIINNVLSGLFWFLLPCGLVIVNDIFAYLCGITFGRTKLIEISPKKTLEGFLGAWFFTALASILLTKFLSKYEYFTCPVNNIRTNAWSHLTCEKNSVFVSQDFRLPPQVFEKIGLEYITMKPIYFHALNLASFASLIAPFGGFFASGLKRAFEVKDFGDSIPGHGGITDRVDCQFLMGSFTSLYFETFISDKTVTVETLFTTVLLNLNEQQIIRLIGKLNKFLYENGYFSETVYQKLVDLY